MTQQLVVLELQLAVNSHSNKLQVQLFIIRLNWRLELASSAGMATVLSGAGGLIVV